MDQETSLVELKGIGEKTRAVFEKAGIRCIGDLLSYYPRAYRKFEEISDLAHAEPGKEIAVYGALERALTVQYVKRLQIVSSIITDQTGRIAVRWFHMPYLRNTLKAGAYYVFCGRVVQKGTRVYLEQPSVFAQEQYRELLKGLQPVYALTAGLTNRMVAKAARQALDGVAFGADHFSADLRARYCLCEYSDAIREIHFPEDESHRMTARRRLVFDEFFFFILALRRLKEQRGAQNHFVIRQKAKIDEVIARLDYQLTDAQKRVWAEISSDMTGKYTMARLIQGDVGSGKTILAFLAMILTALNQLQSCLMVPTEVLARQHFESLAKLIREQKLPFTAILLTGSMTAAEKRGAYQKIAAGDVDMIVGTHALIQQNVAYHRLGLVITDEQHRFGVRQREMLGEKGEQPHTLVMSATPIPRTLAVILYGDLELSVLDELPANRLPIKNCVVNTSYRKKAYRFIDGEVKKGHQAYIICPMVEESGQMEAEDVLSYAERAAAELPGVRVDYLHGKMKPKEKNDVMERFLAGEIQVLVSTTVVEVGVNVPNATVMMIENAERFGLAQLHQLRGRVGRGKAQSYCIMVSSSDSPKTQKRLAILNQSNDGFFIAAEDLKLRGPGDLFGVRQSGILAFRIADVFTDAPILQEACRAVEEIEQNDPQLLQPQHIVLHKKLEHYMTNDLKKLNL